MPAIELETPRLLLRPPRIADAQTIFEAYACDPEVTRYVIWPTHRDPDETRRFLRECVAEMPRDHRFPWVLIERDSGALIGMMELRRSGHVAEAGYVLARPSWGRGYATEALRRAMDFGWSEPGLRRIWAACDTENLASARVMEKAGMQREGVLRRYAVMVNLGPDPRDVFCYAAVR